MSDQAVLLPNLSPFEYIILSKGQLDHLYTFWTMPIIIFSPGANFGNHPLLCCFPKCWFFVQWRTSRRNETCADQTRRNVRIIMRTFHSVHGISTYLAQRVTRWDFMKTSCIFSFDSSMSSIVFYLNCTAKLPMWLTKSSNWWFNEITDKSSLAWGRQRKCFEIRQSST